MIIVGVGCGPDLLTMRGARTIFNAKRVVGSERAVALAEEFIQEGCMVHIIEDVTKIKDFPADTVVLSTGDPMLAGLGKYEGEVISGISSMQVAFARLKIPLETVSVVSAHGVHHHKKALEEAVKEVKRGKNVFLLADPNFKLDQLAKAFLEKKVECQIALCENLGYEEERIQIGSPSQLPEVKARMFSLVIGRW